jgi:hypothetical protein
MTNFQKALNLHLTLTSRTIPKALNSRMYYLLAKCVKYTPKADRQKLESFLGASSTMHTSKTGKQRRVYAYSATRSAYAIMNYRRKLRGEKPLSGDDAGIAVRKFIAKRFRSIGTLKAGWAAAKLYFGRAAGMFDINFEKLPKVKMPSKAVTAKDGFSPEAIATYRLLASKEGQPNTGHIHELAQDAMSKAWNEEYNEMIQHIAKKMDEVTDKVNKR